MKNKDEITRNELTKNMMSRIIFRIDYQGMIDLKDFIKNLQREIEGQFDSMITTKFNNIEIRPEELSELSSTISIPVSEIKNQEIYRFSDNSFGTDKLVMDVSNYSTVLNISCENYTSIDLYLAFFNNYLSILKNKKVNPYISFKRFGLRKIGSMLFENYADIHTAFEKKIFNFEETINLGTPFLLQTNRTHDILKNEEIGLFIHHTRSLEKGYIYEESDDYNKPVYQITLDLDAYLDEESLSRYKEIEKLTWVIETINHEVLFNLFKHSVTQEFLDRYTK